MKEKPPFIEYYKALDGNGVERTYVRATQYFKNRIINWKTNERFRREKNNQEGTQTKTLLRYNDQRPSEENGEEDVGLPF